MSIDNISLEGMGCQGNSPLSGTLDEVIVLKKNNKIKNVCDKIFDEYNSLIEKNTKIGDEKVKGFYKKVDVVNEDIKNILKNDYRMNGINFASIRFGNDIKSGDDAYCIRLGLSFPSGRNGDGFLKFSGNKMTLENVCVYKYDYII